MSHHHHHHHSHSHYHYSPKPLTRRDFLKLGGAALGGAALVSCNLRSEQIDLTAVPGTGNQPPGVTLAPGETADTILVNGNIVTLDGARSIVQALAIKNGVIVHAGDDATVRAMAGANTQVIDCGGRTVTPGMNDSHCHLSACGQLGTVYVDLSWPAVFTLADMQAKFAERMASTPEGEWMVGSGWLTFEGRYLDRHDLDPISTRHPIFAINMGGHMAAVNSLALEMAGVTANTADPGTGRFLREADGKTPNGTVLNHPAMDYFRKLWPADFLNVDVYEATVLSPQAKFAMMGVTSFQDNYCRDLDRCQAYFNIASRGGMTIRGQVMNVLEYFQELNGRIDALEAMKVTNDYMHLAGAKVQMDGALECAFTNEPHNGIAHTVSIWQPNHINEVVRAFHDAGYQVSMHTIGDAALDMALDAIENAMNRNPRPDPRHRIEHAVLNSPSALQRTKDLGVVICTQPTLIRAFGDASIRIFGEERAQTMIPTRTWLDMGIPLALSSDAPSMPWWDPMSTLASAQARYTASKVPVSLDQALTLDEAIYAHTMGSAYADHCENQKGSLEAGKFADLIIWHDSPWSVTPVELINVTIDLTMVGGKVVHQA